MTFHLVCEEGLSLPSDLPAGVAVSRMTVRNTSWDKVELPPVSDGDHLVIWAGVNEISHNVTTLAKKSGASSGIASIFSIVNSRVSSFLGKIASHVAGKSVKVLVCSPYGFVWNTSDSSRNKFTRTFFTTDSAERHKSVASLMVGSLLYNAQERGFDFLDCTVGQLEKTEMGRVAGSVGPFFATSDTLKGVHAKISAWIASAASAASASASASAAP
jgi:hypothetical protein